MQKMAEERGARGVTSARPIGVSPFVLPVIVESTVRWSHVDC